MAELKDVNPDSSAGEGDPNVVQPGSSDRDADVTGDGGEGNRPLQNVRAEFDRKLGRLEQTLEQRFGTLTDAVNRLAVPPASAVAPVNAPSGAKEYTDEELLEEMSQGSKQATKMYTERVAARQAQMTAMANEAQRIIAQQINMLGGKYPQLRDPKHPLAQAVAFARTSLISAGWPNNAATFLEAIKTTLIDRDDLVAEIRSSTTRAKDTSRGFAAFRSSAAGTPPAPKATIPVKSAATTLSPKERAVAARMGVKDPAKSKERFYKRHEEGQSSVSPTVAMIVDQQEGGRK